jgi:hypothetical protein
VLDNYSNSATHFEQIYERALIALENAMAIYDHANDNRRSLRNLTLSVEEFTDLVVETDLDYRNRLIEVFGTPYEGTIGPGKTYPAGYSGPDYYYFQYIDVNEYSSSTVPPPNSSMKAYFTPSVSYPIWNKSLSKKIYNLPEMFKYYWATDLSLSKYAP